MAIFWLQSNIPTLQKPCTKLVQQLFEIQTHWRHASEFTGCSLNIVFFSKNSRKFVTSPSPALVCYWLYKKLPANRSDCTLALRWRSLTAMWAREGLQWIEEKHNFSWTPCTLYIYNMGGLWERLPCPYSLHPSLSSVGHTSVVVVVS